ncbi:MAG: hypothetical protein N3A61_01765, partial [Ignavibacteria bacterium]|nr:hypothetical protein [Ignavibacteria bacterium]
MLLILGVIASILRFYFEIKPEFLEINVFAIYSQYLETQKFVFITNNISEEICGIFLVIGLSIVVLSKEKVENEFINHIRLKSFVLAVYFNSIFLLFALIFFYGFGFMYASFLALISYMIMYLLIFNYFRING